MEGISNDALAKLARHSWPGNIRELENTIRRAVVLARSPILTAGDCLVQQLEAANEDSFQEVVGKQIDHLIRTDESQPYHHLISEVEQMLIKKALELCDGNQVQAASLLGINRMTLRKKLASA